MSSAQSARGQGADADVGSRDARNLLVSVIVRAVKGLRPRILVVENVPAFLTRQVRHPETLAPVSAARLLIGALARDYVAYPLLADLADYRVPQSRRRSFLTLIHRSEKANQALAALSAVPYPSVPEGSSHIAVQDALSSFGLPPLDAADAKSASSDLDMHFVPHWPAERYAMINAIPRNSGRSAWENDSCVNCGRRTRDRSRVRCSSCHRPLPRPIVKGEDGNLRLISGFKTSYRRMEPREPAATITTASGHVGSDRTIHPWENRVLSPLECALLQSIPLSFDWGTALQRWGHTTVRDMIGEAVPPLFTEKHGVVLLALLEGRVPASVMHQSDARVVAARRALARAAACASERSRNP